MVMIKRVLALLGSGALAILLLRQAETAAQAVRDGVQLCLTSVIPALFPFFAVSSLLVALGAAEAAGRALARAGYAVEGPEEIALADYILLPLPLDAARTPLAELLRAAQRCAERGLDWTEENLSANMYSAGIPDPELVIRPGGEMRLSNFLLWQCAYSELYFCDTLWPDFTRQELDKAIIDYQRRDRRFGGVK